MLNQTVQTTATSAAPDLGVRRKKMKLITLAISLLLLAPAYSETWTIHWEAAKGDMTAEIPVSPKNLSHYLFSIPAGHPESEWEIKNGLTPASAEARILGSFKGMEIISIEQKLEDSYYSRFHLIVAEIEEDRFLPIYVNQYALGHSKHSEPIIEIRDDGFSVIVTVTVPGTSSSQEIYRITSDLKNEPLVEQIDAHNPDRLRLSPSRGLDVGKEQ